jgi:polar amino acid transport system substrate-binding protein
MKADSRVADLIRAERIRIGLFPSFFYSTSANGERRGFAIEIATALAAHIGVELVLLEYASPPDVVGALKTSECDIAFLGFDPSRATAIDFTPPYVRADFTFLVPATSSIRSMADADSASTRIAVVSNHAMETALKGKLTTAERILAETPDIAFELLRNGDANVLAGIRPGLLKYATLLPGSRVLQEAYGANILALAVAKGRLKLLGYLSDFLDHARTTGLVRRAIESAGLDGIQIIAP